MQKIKNFFLWVIAGFLTIMALPFMPSMGSLMLIVAALMVVAVVYGVDGVTPASIALIDYSEVGIIIASLVVMGVVITVLFSAIAINMFVNMKSNKIYLY